MLPQRRVNRRVDRRVDRREKIRLRYGRQSLRETRN